VSTEPAGDVTQDASEEEVLRADLDTLSRRLLGQQVVLADRLRASDRERARLSNALQAATRARHRAYAIALVALVLCVIDLVATGAILLIDAHGK